MLTRSSLRPGLVLSRWRAPSLTLPTDAGQIGRGEAFPAQELAHGLVAVLSFQINLELLLGGQEPPFLIGTLVRSLGWVATAYKFLFCFEPPKGLVAL